MTTDALQPAPAGGVPPGGLASVVAASAVPGAGEAPEPIPLPPLRDDLGIHPGQTRMDGAPTWVLEDPVRGRYFRIGWLEFELLSRWSCGEARELLRRMNRETLLRPALEEIQSIRDFLMQHELVVNAKTLAAAREGKLKKAAVATRALHHYLMFRVPLVNPDRFLERMLPWVRPLLGGPAFTASLVAGVVGLLFAFLQWDTFASTFIDTLSWQGLFSYAIALVFAKVIHELGHAFTAKHLGLRVPRIGVAIVLLFPMLYTDTGETWRLSRRRDRFRIAAAGMRIEVMLAAWSTLAWSFLPEGPLRSACFFLATTSWLITLAINVSPFLRFDGYYMMSDASGIPNLHEEAAKSVRYFLRKRLLGIDEPRPTIEGSDAPGWLIGFGLATLVYRFFLFLGIALAVYHFFFKLLGIFLFIIEIWWFILKPVWTEVKAWWKARTRIRLAPALRTLSVLGVLIAILFIPWQDRIFAKGWVRAGQESALHVPRSAKMLRAPQAGPVMADQVLAALDSSELQLREARAATRIDTLDRRLAAAVVSDGTVAESVRSTRAQLAQQRQEAQGAGVEASQLNLTAPFSGVVVDVARDAVPGFVVSPREQIARVIDPTRWIAEVFVDEDQVKRLHTGATVKAYLAGLSYETLSGRIQQIDTVPVEQLPAEMLADRFGGPLPTTQDLQTLKPRRALYRVRVQLEGAPRMQQARLADFAIEADRVSFADSLWRAAMSALVLQTNF